MLTHTHYRLATCALKNSTQQRKAQLYAGKTTPVRCFWKCFGQNSTGGVGITVLELLWDVHWIQKADKLSVLQTRRFWSKTGPISTSVGVKIRVFQLKVPSWRKTTKVAYCSQKIELPPGNKNHLVRGMVGMVSRSDGLPAKIPPPSHFRLIWRTISVHVWWSWSKPMDLYFSRRENVQLWKCNWLSHAWNIFWLMWWSWSILSTWTDTNETQHDRLEFFCREYFFYFYHILCFPTHGMAFSIRPPKSEKAFY